MRLLICFYFFYLSRCYRSLNRWKMARENQIYISCQVEGWHGLLVDNPSPTKKRRVRSKLVRAVLQAEGTHSWIVVFDVDNRSKVVKSSLLKVVPNDTGVPINELREVAEPVVSDYIATTTISTQSVAESGLASESSSTPLVSPEVLVGG